MDTSGSMRRAMDTAKQAARAFVTALRPTDPLALVRFSDKVVFEHELSERRQTTLEAIDRLEANGGTALFDALYDSMSFLKQRQGRRAIVLLSDGRDENNPGTAPGSVHTVADALALVRETDTTVYAIGLGTNVDRPALEAAGRALGRRGDVPGRRQRARRRVPARARRAAPALRRRLHLDQFEARRRLAAGRGRQPDSPASPSGAPAATSPRSRRNPHRRNDEDRRPQRILDDDRTGDRRGPGGHRSPWAGPTR